ncbi:MAG: hypothetical protein CLLPBCKN_005029 [Chroococcidiopsis cubana SAG 39.79]|nr:hypothetical protein [Chroococcidiopsis cubana SAG 39.79]
MSTTPATDEFLENRAFMFKPAWSLVIGQWRSVSDN